MLEGFGCAQSDFRAKKRGVKVPEDISVIGYDNIQINNFFAYDLSTIDQDISDIAKQSVQKLLGTIVRK